MPSSIRIDADRIAVVPDDRPDAATWLPWHEIVEASAGVLDLVASRIVELELVHVSGHVLTLTDAMDGWHATLATLGDHLPLVVDDVPLAMADLDGGDTVLVARR